VPPGYYEGEVQLAVLQGLAPVDVQPALQWLHRELREESREQDVHCPLLCVCASALRAEGSKEALQRIDNGCIERVSGPCSLRQARHFLDVPHDMPRCPFNEGDLHGRGLEALLRRLDHGLYQRL